MGDVSVLLKLKDIEIKSLKAQLLSKDEEIKLLRSATIGNGKPGRRSFVEKKAVLHAHPKYFVLAPLVPAIQLWHAGQRYSTPHHSRLVCLRSFVSRQGNSLNEGIPSAGPRRRPSVVLKRPLSLSFESHRC